MTCEAHKNKIYVYNPEAVVLAAPCALEEEVD
jgi:formaldehyde-activating enzyme involved in methanogenesis